MKFAFGRSHVSEKVEGPQEKRNMTEPASDDSLALPIEWTFPPGLVSRPATNIIVQHTEHEFTISFFEVQQPILLGTPEQNRAILEKMGSVQMMCVARVIISASRMPEVVEVLRKNLEQYRSAYEESEGGTPTES